MLNSDAGAERAKVASIDHAGLAQVVTTRCGRGKSRLRLIFGFGQFRCGAFPVGRFCVRVVFVLEKQSTTAWS